MDTSDKVILTAGHMDPVNSTAVNSREVSSYRNRSGNNQKKPSSCSVPSVNCQSCACGYGVTPGISWGTGAK
ncbi:hypothetical protein DPMN_034338 [Dreissena polymorpha]|uniref:Uncharacterized protein n=1 Tax=Dreissena polymorpha TaxID=45954 RepID=A0A9D4M7C5_DREPO|nr:hypothetical protein DPMN_034338 [Dreissena polymorpha]